MEKQNNLKSERDIRLEKSNLMRKIGVNPYPSKYDKSHSIKEAKLEKEKTKVSVNGRIMLIREMGGLIFANIKDNTGLVQLVLDKKILKDKLYPNTDLNYFKFWQKFCDMADFVGVEGEIFVTKKGELSILVDSFKFLSKALSPLPEKWHGLKDQEEKYRKRYLDILLNDDVKKMFVQKSKFWQSIRSFLLKEKFLEVETPVLETTTGGADAEPFATHHNALNLDVYLRISGGELWQKKLMVAGFNKVFEIGRIFRNEGMDMEHLQDYTQMEFYWAYANFKDSQKLVEEMYKHVALETFDTLKFKIKGFDVDLGKKWEVYDFREEVLKNTDIDILKTTLDDIKTKLDELGVKYDKTLNMGRGMDYLWKYCRKKIAGPGFLINHPVEVSPLAKKREDSPNLVERFQVIIAGSEMGNGYSELNDPIDQANRFMEQSKLRDAGDKEAQMYDYEFVESLEHGMPPTTGFGLSERLFSFLMDKSIRDCVIFPLMKPNTNLKKNDKVSQSDNQINIEMGNDEPEIKSITRGEAFSLVNKHNKDKANLNHYLETEVIMKSLAKKLGYNEFNWGLLGLLHDLDWEKTVNDIPNHTLQTEKILADYKLPEWFIYAIKSHSNEQLDNKFPPKSTVDFALRCAESITGLIYACVLVRPDKQISELKVKSVKKKFKDKSFAAKVNRNIIKECEKLNISLEDFIELSIKAMQDISDEIGLF